MGRARTFLRPLRADLDEARLLKERMDVPHPRKRFDPRVRTQLATAFDKFSLTEINPAGQKFDPHRHQAMSMVEADAEPNTVVQVLQKGYALYERVLRPALVVVAKGKDRSA